MGPTRSRSLFSSTALFFLMCLFQPDTGIRRSAGSEQSVESNPSLIQPADLVGLLKSTTDPKPLLIQVGFNVLYVQAHIPGSEYIGPASSPDAVRRLQKRVDALPRTQPIVLYCGCCPWSECPNIKPAYKELDAMGFKNMMMLYIAHNFGKDWVAKNYPVAKG